MSTKTFSFYNTTQDAAGSKQLVVEIGKSHAVCMATSDGRIDAFELFTYTKEEATSFDTCFASINVGSVLLDKTFSSSVVYINNERSLLVPGNKFNKEIAEDYLKITFGDATNCRTLFDKVEWQHDIMVVSQVPEKWIEVINNRLRNPQIKHSYGKIIGNLANGGQGANSICAYFYHQHFIVVAIKGSQLQLVQSYAYTTPEDVLYNLLNVTEQLKLYSNDLKLQIAGLIDLKSVLYDELVKYFRDVEVKNVDDKDLNIDLKEYPLHYFTPFIQLTV